MSGGPPAPVRVAGKAMTRLVARFPATWPLLRRPTRRFFDRLAPEWDQRTANPQRLAPLEAAVGRIGGEPARILDLGTGTGNAATWLAERFPGSRVTGVDLSDRMIAAARSKLPAALQDRVEFEVADASALRFENGEFDLVAQVSTPPFFAETARVLASGAPLVVVSSLGTGTPFHTPVDLLRSGFEREGLAWVGHGAAGPGTYYLFRKPA